MTKWTADALGTTIGTSAAVAWAIDVGLFERLADEPRSIDDLAADLACDVRGLDALLGVLVAMGLARVDSGRASLNGEARTALERAPGSMHSQLSLWRMLGRWMRDGRSLFPDDGATRDVVYANVVRDLEARFAPAAEALAERVGPARGPILDVGAGSGVWSLTMAARDPDATVTGLDGRETCGVFLQRAEERGLAGRVDVLAGDYHHLPLPEEGFARIVLGNVLHLESRERAGALVRRVRSALRPGGSLVVIDALRDGEAEHAMMTAVYRLHLTMRVQHGGVYARRDFESWMEAAGLTRCAWNALPTGLWALSAEAP